MKPPTWVPLVQQLLNRIDAKSLAWVHTLVGVELLRRISPAAESKPKRKYRKRKKAKLALASVPKNGRRTKKHAA